MITINGSEVYIDGVNVGILSDAKANYPARAAEIQSLWDGQHPPAPEPEPAP